jgi:hypothetical protein
MTQEGEEDQPVVAEELFIVPVLDEGSETNEGDTCYKLNPEERLYDE